MKRLGLLPLILLLPACLFAQGDPLAWLNGVRYRAGAAAVTGDALLSETAALWAARLAAAGTLSHRGNDGSTALDRYRAQGGTEVRVGEILGAGPALPAIEKGWMESAEHRQLALSPLWTHAGWGSAASGTSQVTVMMFAEKVVAGLLIARSATGLTVSGTFVPQGTARGVLYDGPDPLAPAEWNPESKRFLFEVPGPDLDGYYRLGYVAEGGRFTLTNAFTWPRGKGSPGAGDRSAPPAASP
ncbi:MAG: CAP domain-containing protein [Spirochaetia bacterium]